MYPKSALSTGVGMCSLLAVSACLMNSSAQAQATAAPQDAAESTGRLSAMEAESIVVTARKRSENIRDVPVAIKALSGDQLAQANVTQLISLTAAVPSFNVTYGGSLPFTFVRGFGSGASLSFDQAVGKFIDNISYGRDQDARVPLFDVERIEVLKGPQVLVFGNSATAGALNIATKKPSSALEGNISSSYEFENQEVRVEGGVTLPINEWASVRVGGLFQHLDKGWVKNLGTGANEPKNHNAAVRGTLRLTPDPDVEILLKAEYDDMRDRGYTMQPYTAQLTPGFPAFAETRFDDVRSVSNRDAPFFNDERSIYKNQTYQGDVNWDVAGGTVTSTTALRRMNFRTSLDGDGYAIPIFNAVIQQRYRQFSQELRFHRQFGPVEMTAGGYYEHGVVRAFALENFNLAPLGLPLPPFTGVVQFRQRQKASSGFVDLNYHVTPALTLSGSVRYTHTVKRADQAFNGGDIILNQLSDDAGSRAAAAVNAGYDPLMIGVLGVTPHRYTGLRRSEGHWQPQAIVQYEVAPKTMAYVKFVKGAKAGGFDWISGAATAAETEFDTEGAKSWEVGIKGLILDNRLDFSLTAFRTTFSNLQVSVFKTSSFLVSNVGEARSQGLEADVTLRPIDGLRINASGIYLDSKYISFPGASCTPIQQAAAGPACVQDLSGAPTPYASKWSGTLGFTYEHGLGDRFRLSWGGSVIAKSKFNAGSANNPLEEQGGYAQLDAFVDLKPASGPWSAGIFARNLTDKRYFEFAAPTVPPSGGAEMAAMSRGRQIGLRVSANF